MNIYFFEDISKTSINEINNAYRNIPIERIIKANEYRFFENRRLSIIAYLVLKYALNDRFNILLNKYHQFEYGDYGKPFLKDFKDIYFSISHCKDAVACSVSKYQTGIDVQDIIECDFNVVDNFFSEKEGLDLIKSKQQNIDFTKFWVLKESYIKKKGTSIAFMDKNLDFSQFKSKPFIQDGCKFYINEFESFIIGSCVDGNSDEFKIKKIYKNNII
ncbi:MAG: 4'-phosphopantetheinyl transferase family protein [Oscillospiraceae bacterium]